MSTVAAIESDIGRHEREWEDLVERSGASPFHELAWLTAWWSAFGRGGLMLITVRRDGELAAALPLRVSRGRLASPTNWHSPLFGPVADAEDSARDLLDYVFGLERRSIDLSHLDVDDGSLARAVQAAQRAGRPVATRPLAQSPSRPGSASTVRGRSAVDPGLHDGLVAAELERRLSATA